MLFDTHAHLDQPEFETDRGEVIARAADAGVATVVAVGTTALSSCLCADLADQIVPVYAAVGIQPNYVADAEASDWETVVTLTARPGVVAIGETGLDGHWDFAPLDLQRDYFSRHLQLSRRSGLPVIVHMRDIAADMLEMLRAAHRHGPLHGVMHSFTGTPALAEECIAMGLYISFAGMVTFKKSTVLRQCAAEIPADRIVIETDSPYLSPHPVRGQRRNEPANLLHTARCLAEVRGVTFEQFAAQTTANAQRLFGLPQ